MAEQLLTKAEVCKRFCIGYRRFQVIEPKLRARGLKRIMLTDDGNPRYLESSIDRMLLQAAETERPILPDCGKFEVNFPDKKRA